jgi:hypothetical protein
VPALRKRGGLCNTHPTIKNDHPGGCPEGLAVGVHCEAHLTCVGCRGTIHLSGVQGHGFSLDEFIAIRFDPPICADCLLGLRG